MQYQNIPTEDIEQQQVFDWACFASGKYPELENMYHIPNGGKRDKITAERLRRQGVKAGVPDIFLSVARCGYHGLYIELKRIKGGTVSQPQKDWIERLTKQGYFAVVCKGAEKAIETIKSYLEGKA